jgi:apolipoprotein D and lipocalin family protein
VRIKTRRVLRGAGLGAVLWATTAWGQVTAVPRLDFGKFAGAWYQIEKFPTKKEKACAGNAVVMFTKSEKPYRFDVVRSCTTKDDTADTVNMVGRMENKSGDGRLKVGLFWPVLRRYWVLATGPDYQWAVIGDPQHKTLWVLSRKTTLGADDLATAKAKAQAEGFDVSKLVGMTHGQ